MPQADAYLIAGAGGMLGTALQRTLGEHGISFSAPVESEFDVTDEASVQRAVAAFTAGLRGGRGVLINAAAYTNVEGAEDDRKTAFRVNEHGARLLASHAHAAGLGFVHISTDFVFDGHKPTPYVEDDATAPLSAYGDSKLAGELAARDAHPDALVVRTAWSFGPSGSNFPSKILEAARTRSTLTVVTDEVGSPTYTLDLAVGLRGLVGAGATGIYHLTASGFCSRFELACEVLALAGVDDVTVQPSTGSATARVARPKNSVLDCSKAAALGVALPHWRSGLERYLASRDTAEATATR